ncbi:MAG: DUF1573 domain-containing protein, partial [Pirellulales bacterium]
SVFRALNLASRGWRSPSVSRGRRMRAAFLAVWRCLGQRSLARLVAARFLPLSLARPPAAVGAGALVIVISVVAFAGLLSAGCGRSNVASSNAPNAAHGGLAIAEPELFDFGEHRQDELLSHDFTIVNRGQAPIEIVGLKTSCPCIRAAVEDWVAAVGIEPGQSFPLTVQMPASDAQDSVSGWAAVDYRTQHNGSPSPTKVRSLTVRFRAAITPDYRISPRSIDLGTVDGLALKEVIRTVHLAPAAVADVQVKDVKSASPFLTAEILRERATDGGVDVAIRVDPSHFAGRESFNGSIVLATGSPRVPNAVITVRGTYNAPAVAEPSVIVIGSDEEGTVERIVRLTTSRAARVRAARFSIETAVRLELTDGPSATEHFLRLFVPPSGEHGLDCELNVDLDFVSDAGVGTTYRLVVPIHRIFGDES